jgi:DNA-binding NarL/FixJ family response regulator
MIKVAIVEDTAELRLLWTDILNQTEGFICVGSFSNATDAVVQLPRLRPDVILMDIQLSLTEMGVDVIRQLRAQGVDSQFLMFSIFENDDAFFESLKAGARGYILKNTTPQKVLEAIIELHEGGSPMSAGIARRVLNSFQPEKGTPQYNITSQEKKVLERLAKGLFYKEIADSLDLKLNTIKQYCHSIYKKLEVSNRTEAVNKYFNHPPNPPTTNKS